MLAVIDIPENLQEIYEQSKELSVEIFEIIKGLGSEQEVPGNQDLLELDHGFI
jgi:hypothetical protein